ncbi:hypothetical protein SGRIM128S_03619 [Streptomyces griseomycini]
MAERSRAWSASTSSSEVSASVSGEVAVRACRRSGPDTREATTDVSRGRSWPRRAETDGASCQYRSGPPGVPSMAGAAPGASSSAPIQYRLRSGSPGTVTRPGVRSRGSVDQYAPRGARGSTMPVTRTASGARPVPGTWRTDPTPMFSFRAVSELTAASTVRVVAVTVPRASGRRPARSRAWSASPCCATSEKRGGRSSGRDSQGSGTVSFPVVRTPWVDCPGSRGRDRPADARTAA